MMAASSARIGVQLFEPHAKIHQGVVPLAGIVPVKCCGNQRHDLAVMHLAAAMKKEMDEYRANVGLDERFGCSKGKGGHSAGAVGADAGKGLQFASVTGELPAETADNLLGTPFQGYGPSIVAQPLPYPQNILQRRGGQGCEGGKCGQKLCILDLDPLYLGLLEHDLSGQDVVGVPG